MTYFPDGSLALISASSIIFYPNAKDYELLKQERELERKARARYLDRSR